MRLAGVLEKCHCRLQQRCEHQDAEASICERVLGILTMSDYLQYVLLPGSRSDWRAYGIMAPGRSALGVSGHVWACLGVSGSVWPCPYGNPIKCDYSVAFLVASKRGGRARGACVGFHRTVNKDENMYGIPRCTDIELLMTP